MYIKRISDTHTVIIQQLGFFAMGLAISKILIHSLMNRPIQPATLDHKSPPPSRDPGQTPRPFKAL